MQFLMYVFAGLFEFFLVRFQRFSAYCVASLIQALPMSICLSVCLSVSLSILHGLRTCLLYTSDAADE